MEFWGIIIGLVTVVFASWASVWYRIGKLTSQVKQLNDKIHNIEKQVEHLITSKYNPTKPGGE